MRCVHKAALDACDALDGVKDGVLEDPAHCRFDPKCCNAPVRRRTRRCLTAPQVAAVSRIYAPATNPRTGRRDLPGLAPGSELGWGALAGGPKPLSISDDHFKYVVFNDPDWDFRTFDFDRDLAKADQTRRRPDQRDRSRPPRVRAHGGKLLMYHGWNDQLIAPQNSIDYYGSVTQTLGAESADKFVRLFMAPGMGHCGGGTGPNTFDMLAALEQWVGTGHGAGAGHRVTQHRGTIDRTRPLCPYPQVAQYRAPAAPTTPRTSSAGRLRARFSRLYSGAALQGCELAGLKPCATYLLASRICVTNRST